jgi:hypothetical protein
MKEFVKKNFAILMAFILPIGLIGAITLSIYVPSFFLSTSYNFVYSSCSDGTNYYNCGNYLEKRYSVVDGKIVANIINPNQDSDRDGIPDVNEYTSPIFMHDTKKNESREISLAEAQTLTLNNLLTSPDGVTFSDIYERGAGYFLIFDGRSSYGHYLTKGNTKSKLNLINADNDYYRRGNFQFIGWVLPGRN